MNISPETASIARRPFLISTSCLRAMFFVPATHTHMHICQFPIYLYRCDIYHMYISKPGEDNEYPLQNVNICIYTWVFRIPFTRCKHLQIHMSVNSVVRAHTLICTYRQIHVKVSIHVYSEEVSDQRLWIRRGRVYFPLCSLPCCLAVRGLIRNGHISSCYTQIQHTHIWKPSTDRLHICVCMGMYICMIYAHYLCVCMSIIYIYLFVLTYANIHNVCTNVRY